MTQLAPLDDSPGISIQRAPYRPSDKNQHHRVHHHARGEEQHVVKELVRVIWQDMMEAENLMIDNSLNEVEQAASDQDCASECLA